MGPCIHKLFHKEPVFYNKIPLPFSLVKQDIQLCINGAMSRIRNYSCTKVPPVGILCSSVGAESRRFLTSWCTPNPRYRRFRCRLLSRVALVRLAGQGRPSAARSTIKCAHLKVQNNAILTANLSKSKRKRK